MKDLQYLIKQAPGVPGNNTACPLPARDNRLASLAALALAACVVGLSLLPVTARAQVVPQVNFLFETEEVGESVAGGQATLTIVTTSPPPGPIEVNYRFLAAQSSATLGVDANIAGLSGTTGSVRLTPTAPRATINVSVVDDSRGEGVEELLFELVGSGTTPPQYNPGLLSASRLRIYDDDGGATRPEPRVSFATPDSGVAVEGETVEVEVRVTPPPAADLTINYMPAGTATSGDDYPALSGRLTVPADAGRAFLPVMLTDDTDNELTESLILMLQGGSGYSLGGLRQHRLSIAPGDLPRIGFGSATSTAMEPPGEEDGDGGPLTSTDIALSLSPAPARPIWVGYRVSGSANAGYDYTGLADAGLAITDMIGSLRIEAGTATHTIRLGIPSDLLREGTETLTLELLTPTAGDGYTLGTTTSHTLSIRDDPEDGDRPLVRFGAPSSVTVAAGASVDVPLVVDALEGASLSVRLAVDGDQSTAEATDYNLPPATTVTTATGTNLRLRTNTDGDSEDDILVLRVAASSAGDYDTDDLGMFADSRFVVRIQDSAAAGSGPTVQFASAESLAMEVRPISNSDTLDTSTHNVTLTRSNTSGELSVQLAAVGRGGAIDGPSRFVEERVIGPDGRRIREIRELPPTDDYRLDSPTVTFAAGQRRASAMMTIFSDEDPGRSSTRIAQFAQEGEQVVELLLLPGSGYQLGARSSHRVTIRDGFTISQSECRVVGVSARTGCQEAIEGDVLEFSFSMTNNLSRERGGNLAYNAPVDAHLCFVDNRTSQIGTDRSDPDLDFLVLNAVPDGICTRATHGTGVDGPGPAFRVTLQPGQTRGRVLIEIVDDDRVDRPPVREFRGSTLVTVDGDDRLRAGFAPIPGSFARGGAEGGSPLRCNQGTGGDCTIADNDVAPPATPVVNFDADTSAVDEAAGTVMIPLTVRNPPPEGLVIDYRLSGSAEPDADYVIDGVPAATGRGSLFVPPSGMAAILLWILDDPLPGEPDRTLALALQARAGDYQLGGRVLHTLTLSDNDDAGALTEVSFETGRLDVNEAGGSAVFVVNAVPPTIGAGAGTIANPFTVDYRLVAADTNAPASVYTIEGGNSGTLSFSDAGRQAQISVTLRDNSDEDTQASRILTIELVQPEVVSDHLVVAPFTAQLVINDDDGANMPTPRISFALPVGNGDEGTTAEVEVLASPPPASDLTVNYVAPPAGSATSGEDYTALSGQFTVPRGAGRAVLPVMLSTDTVNDPGENLFLTLQDGDGYTLGSQRRHRLNIDDRNSPRVSFVQATSTVAEPGGEEARSGVPLGRATITLNLSPVPAQPIWVGYRVSGTASAGLDYLGLSASGETGSLRVEAGQNTRSIALGFVSDLLREGTETLVLELLPPVDDAGYTLGSPATHALSITDDPMDAGMPIVRFGSPASVTVVEGMGVDIPLIAEAFQGSPLSVRLEVDGAQSTAEGADYTLPGATMLSTATGTTVRLQTRSDTDNEDEVLVLRVADSTAYDTDRAMFAATRFVIRIQDSGATTSGPVVEFQMAESLVEEPNARLSGTTAHEVVLTRSNTTGSLTVNFQVVGLGAAVAGPADFSVASNMVTFAPGRAQARATVTINPDNGVSRAGLQEGEQVVQLLLLPGGNYRLGPRSSHRVNILERVRLPTSIQCRVFGTPGRSCGNMSEGDIMELSGEIARRVGVADGFALNASRDVHFCVNDSLSDSIGTDRNNPALDFIVLNAIPDGRCENAEGYDVGGDGPAFRTTVAPGQVRARILVEIVDDDNVEGPNQNRLAAVFHPIPGSLVEIGGGGDDTLRCNIGNNPRACSIIDNDVAPPPTPMVQFQSTASDIDENLGTVSIPLTVSNPPPDGLTIEYRVSGGDARVNSDYTIDGLGADLRARTLVIGTGGNLIIGLVDDRLSQPAVTLELTLVARAGDYDLGAITRHTLTINDEDAEFPPEAVGSLPALRLIAGGGDRRVELTDAFMDENEDDVLTYEASSGDPGIATVRVAGDELVVTPGAAGATTVAVTAVDRIGLRSPEPQTITVTVRASNDPPPAPALADQNVVRVNTYLDFRYQFDAVTDPDGDPVSYSAAQTDGSALPSWLRFNPNTRTFNGRPPDSAALGTVIPVRVTVTDGFLATAFADFTITLAPATLTVTPGALDVAALNNARLVLMLDGIAFNTGMSGSLLNRHFELLGAPTGLRISSLETPTSAQFRDFNRLTLILRYDGGALSNERNFGIRVLQAALNVGQNFTLPAASGVTIIPTASDPMPSFGSRSIADQTYTVGDMVALTLPEASSGDNPLSYTLSPAPPSGLSFANRVISGIPNAVQASTNHTYTVTDADATDPDTATLTFMLEVLANRAPATPVLADQSVTEGVSLSYRFTGVSDPDGDPVTYNAERSGGGALPSWLSFDSATRTFSGRPATGDVGEVAVRVIAADDRTPPLTATATFMITVARIPSPDASLSTLTLSDVTLSPGFAPDVTVYTATVDSAIMTTTVSATATDGGATVVLSPVDADPMTAGHQVSLTAGDNGITVIVTAEDGTIRRYRITVTRELPAVAIGFSEASYSGTEGGTVEVTVTLTATPERPVSVLLRSSLEGGATAADFRGTIPSLVTFAATASGADLSQSFTLTVVDDDDSDPMESILLAFGSLPEQVTPDVNSMATVALRDNDSDRIILSFTPATVAEDAGATNVAVTARLVLTSVPILTTQTAVALSLAGTAVDPDDYGTGPLPPLSFAVGATDGATVTEMVNLTPMDDTVVERTETLIFGGTATGMDGIAVIPPMDALSLTDTDTATVSLAGPGGTVDEGATADFTATLSAEVETDVTVNWTAVDVADADGEADITMTSGSVTFPMGTTTQTISVPIADDTLSEGAETFMVTLDTVTVTDVELDGRVTPDSTAAEAMIANNDRLIVGLEEALVAVIGESNAYTVSLMGENRLPAAGAGIMLTVPYTIAGSGSPAALAGDLPGVTAGSVMIAAGSSSADIQIDIPGGATDGRQFTLTLGTPTLGGIAGAPAPMIASGQGSRDIRIVQGFVVTVDDVDVNENVGNATVTVSVDPTPTQAFTVELALSDDTAMAGEDYGTVPTTVSFAMGEDSQTVSVPIINDVITEGDEGFTVSLSNPVPTMLSLFGTNVPVLANDTASVTISANDALSVGLEPASVAVLDQSNFYTVSLMSGNRLPAAGAGTLTVPYMITGTGSPAAQASDFNDFTGGSVTIAAGSSAADIQIDIPSGATEGAQFTITLGTPTLAGITGAPNPVIAAGQESRAIDIVQGFVVTVEDVDVNENVGNATVTVSVDPTPTQAFAVDLALSDDTAMVGEDYGTVPTTVDFAPNQASQTVSIPIINDVLTEGDESFTVNLSNPVPTMLSLFGTNVPVLANDSASVTISANDALSVGLEAASVAVLDQSNFYTVSLMGGNRLPAAGAGSLTVPYMITGTGSPAAQATDFNDFTGGSVTIAAGSSAADIQIDIPSGATEGAQFTITLSPPTLAGITGAPAPVIAAGQGSRAIDIVQGFVVTVEDVDVNENVGNATVTVSVDPTPTQAFAVDLALSDDTAMVGEDYGTVPTTVDFAPNQASQTVSVSIINDVLTEGEESFEVSLSNPVPAMLSLFGTNVPVLANDTASVTISANDALSVGLEAASVAVLDQSNFYTVSLMGENRLPAAGAGSLTVPYTLSGSAVAGTDFTDVTGGRVTIMAGSSAADIQIDIPSGATEGAQFTITLSTPTLAGITGAPVPVIAAGQGSRAIDIVQGFVVTVDDVDVNENVGNATVTVSVDPTPTQAFTVNLALSDDTAMVGEDYGTVPTTVDFAANQASRTVNVPIINDVLTEGEESFEVSLSNPAPNMLLLASTNVPVLANDTASVTISANDALSVGLEAASVAVLDQSNFYTVSLMGENRLPAAGAGSLTVPYTLSGSAVAGTDFTDVTGGRVTIMAGSSAADIQIDIPSGATEGAQFTITLSTPTLAGITGAPAPVIAAGQESRAIDIVQGFVVTVDDVDVNENVGNATVTVSVTPTPTQAFTVNLALSNGTAMAGEDYGTVPTTVDFAANQASQTVSVPIINDVITEGEESFEVSLSNPVPAMLLLASTNVPVLANDTASVTISANDPLSVGLEAASVAVIGQLNTYTVSLGENQLPAAGAGSLTVPYTIAGSGSPSAQASDLPGVTAGNVMIAAGSSSADIQIDIPGGATDGAQFTLTLGTPTLAGITGAPNPMIAAGQGSRAITIRQGYVVTVDDVTVAENAGTADLTVSVTPPPEGPFTVNLATSDGTALAGEDYGAVPTMVSFDIDDTTQTVRVPITNDVFIEADEGFDVSLSVAPDLMVPLAGTMVPVIADATASVTIPANDPLMVGLEPAPVTVRGRTIDYTVSLVGENRLPPTGVSLTVDYEITLPDDNPAVVDEDFRLVDGSPGATGGTVTIEAGSSSAVIQIEILEGMETEGREFGIALAMDSVTISPEIVITDETTGMRIDSLAVSAAQGMIAMIEIVAVDIEQRTQALITTLSAFGRTLSGNLIGIIEDRTTALQSKPGGGGSQVTVAGRTLSMEWLKSALSKAPGAGGGGVVGGRALTPVAGLLGLDDVNHGGTGLREVNLRQLLTDSSFQLALNGDGDRAGSWTLWGRSGISRFDGRPGSNFSVDGEVKSGQIGLDVQMDANILAGLMVNYSEGDSDYAFTSLGGTRGEVDIRLTSLHPYLHWSGDQGLDLWFMLGYGQGHATLEDDSGRVSTDLAMEMAATGVRQELDTEGYIKWALKADGLFTRIDADGRDEQLQALEADTWRLRLGLESTADLLMIGDVSLKAVTELGWRLDGGDAETGMGGEISGGLNYAHPALGLNMSARGHYLLAHRDSDFEEWGASFMATLDPGTPELGLQLSVTPSLGAASSGSGSLWEGEHLFGAAVDELTNASALDLNMEAEAAYGLAMMNDRGRLTPFSALKLSDQDARTRLGARMQVLMPRRLNIGLAVYGEQARRADTGGDLSGVLDSRIQRGFAHDMGVIELFGRFQSGAEADYQFGIDARFNF